MNWPQRPPLLLRNDQALGRHWVRLRLVGTQSNRDAIGARIRVRAGERTIERQVMPTRGYLTQSELPVFIGLGPEDAVDGLEIIWPGGETQIVNAVEVDRTTVVVEAR